MAISIVTGFDITNNSPVDLKLLQATTASRDAIPSYQRHIGMTVFVTGSNELYRLQNGIANSNWVLLEKSSSYASTASYAMNGGSGTTLNSASWASQSLSSSHAQNTVNAQAADFALLAGEAINTVNAQAADFALLAGEAITATSASFATTASYAMNGGSGTTLNSASWASSSLSSSIAVSASYGTNADTASVLSGDRVYTSGYAFTGIYIGYKDTNYTLVNDDDGRMVSINSGSSVGVIVSGSALSSTFACTVFQSGSGQVLFITSSGTVLRNRAGHSRMAGQYAMISLIRVISGDFILSGDTAAW